MSDKPTRWENQLRKSGFPIITWDHEEIRDYLLECFRRDYAHYLSIVANDDTNRHYLHLVMNHHDLGGDNFGGIVRYNRKKGAFDYISYSDRRNWAIFFSINSGVYFSAYEHHQQFKKIFPFGASVKKLTEYLLNN